MADLYKNVNGVRIQLTAEESASVVAEWKQNEAATAAVAYIGTRRDAYHGPPPRAPTAAGRGASEWSCPFVESIVLIQ